ncbi:MAG: creatininase family protein [Hyphomicrobiaceae bacterium]
MSLLTQSPWLHERSWPSIKDYLAHGDIVLVPVGATEQHGAHAALMLDTGWAIGISEAVARRTGTLAAPPLHYGWSSGHMGYPGCVTLSAETLTTVLVEICQSLMVHGFRKFVLVNGNRVANVPPMEIAATKLRVQHGALAAVLDIGLVARREVAAIVGEDNAGVGHAGDAETSYLLFHRGDLVDMQKAVSIPPTVGTDSGPAQLLTHLAGPYGRNSVLLKLTPEEFADRTAATGGVGGNAAAATREKGERIFKAVVENSVSFVESLRAIHVPPLRNLTTPV